MAFDIRPVTEADIPLIAALLAEDGFGDDAAARLQLGFEHLKAFSLVGVQDGRILSVVLATFNGWHVFASHLAVSQGRRREGLGRALMDALSTRAAAVGAKGVVADARLSAAGFYDALGFRLPGAVFLIRDLNG